MEMRNMEKIGIDVSLLGFGCMRYPILSDGGINEPEAQKMIDRAYESGINYYDTAYPYHNGKSETFTGKALKKYKRESFYLATKLPVWNVKQLDDAKRLLDEQLKRLQMEYIDFYMFHALSKNTWEKMRDLGVVEYLQDMKKEGKIRNLGFSFHDSFEVFMDILNYTDWDFTQIQWNYMDVEYQAGIKGYEEATKRNIPVIVMEPIKGGSLANLPEDVTAPLQALCPGDSNAKWALRWVGSYENVKVILSGMTTMEQVEDNLLTFHDFTALSEEEKKAVVQVSEALKNRVNNGCTACDYCMPCPVGVNIPQNFKIWNDLGMYGEAGPAKGSWTIHFSDKQKAKNCVECGQCESHCPQSIDIRGNLMQLQKELDAIYIK